MAKLAIVRSSAVSTIKAAVKPVMACSKIEQLPAEKVWAEFKKQVGAPMISQRPHVDQVAAGLWGHLAKVLPTQANLQAVEVIRCNGRSRRKDPGRRLIDGFHRLHYWFEVSANGCPFSKLNLITHQLEVSVHASEAEVAEKVDALARSVDNKKAAKKTSDYLTAAIREAFGDRYAVSRAYRLGTSTVCYLSRTIGAPAQMSGPALMKSVADHIEAHRTMDALFNFVENNRNIRRYASQVFHAGIASAVFHGLVKINTEKGRAFAADVLKNALIAATAAMDGCEIATSVRQLDEDLASVLGHLAEPQVDARLRAIGKNREGFYSQVSKFMAPELAELIRVANRKK